MIPNGLFSKGDHWEAKYPWIFLEISQTIEQPLCTLRVAALWKSAERHLSRNLDHARMYRIYRALLLTERRLCKNV